MSLIEIIILAVVLGIDCLVVSFSQGLIFKSNRVRNSIMLAFSMGFFQGLMPCFGYAGTHALIDFIEPFSHWLVFAIFTALGVKFIYEAFQGKEDRICCIDIKCLITMGLAVSIDAFASGISLKLTAAPLFLSVILIGFTSFIMSLSGFWSGNFFKKLPSKFLEISAGLILLVMAFKVLIIET